jgi:hypothetical protein
MLGVFLPFMASRILGDLAKVFDSESDSTRFRFLLFAS